MISKLLLTKWLFITVMPRAFLYSEDRSEGEDFGHQKQWIISRLKLLSHIYVINICACAVLSDHSHVVLHVDTPEITTMDRKK